MPWNFDYSPLDRTIDQLEWLTNQMRTELESGADITAEDYRSVMEYLGRIVGDLKPLQDLVVQERR